MHLGYLDPSVLSLSLGATQLAGEHPAITQLVGDHPRLHSRQRQPRFFHQTTTTTTSFFHQTTLQPTTRLSMTGDHLSSVVCCGTYGMHPNLEDFQIERCHVIIESLLTTVLINNHFRLSRLVLPLSLLMLYSTQCLSITMRTRGRGGRLSSNKNRDDTFLRLLMEDMNHQSSTNSESHCDTDEEHETSDDVNCHDCSPPDIETPLDVEKLEPKNSNNKDEIERDEEGREILIISGKWPGIMEEFRCLMKKFLLVLIEQIKGKGLL
ncbi:hypothetical protein KSP40_PGU013519 [Platanthera guangdongensis]|uniref:Uncharacterized protein n=1 Tax=Platanthera guangdongensis TaxID=2320717 RepID=A0ABR2LHY8_9ASPA